MGFDVLSLFGAVVDLTADERERYFDKLQVPPEVRAEVTSLCGFDAQNVSLTNCIAEVASEVLRPDFAPGAGTLCGPYKLLRLLGKGGMGTVFLAERADGEIDRRVAIKFIRSGSGGGSGDGGRLNLFLRERQILASLNHPGIGRLFDAGHSGSGQPYLVMEYIEGVPLDEFAGKLELREKLKLFLQVCSALAHAHRNLVIHRDLKPSNILVDANGQTKLLDFGIARILDDQARGLTVERLLTPDYASPEQVLGRAQTTATDVYSLGALLYQLLAGHSPHARAEGSAEPVETIICSVDPPPPSQLNAMLPRDLDFVTAKALRKEPEERYASVDALADDVQAFLEWRPIRARAGSAWYRTRKMLRRRWLPASAIAAALICLSVGLYAANRERLVAQHRFSQLRQLSITLLHLDSDLYALPGATEVRQKVVAASMQYLEGLSRDAGQDRALNLDLATGFLQLAHVQGVPAYPNLGQYGEADKSLRKAEAFAGRAGAEAGNRAALLVAAEADQDRMIVADTEHRRADALAQAQKCAARVELAMRDPAVSKAQLHQSSLLLANVALGFMNMHRYNDAVRYARREVELARSAQAPADYLIGGMGVLANASRQSGDLQGALQAITEARALAETSAFRNQTAKASVLYAVLYRQGVILGEYDSISLDRPAEAIEAFEKAFDVVEQQAAGDPNDANNRDRVATVGRALGQVLVETEPQRALRFFDQALLRLREVKAAAREQRDEALTLALSSYALRRLGRTQEAGERIDAAFALLRATKDYPSAQVVLGDEVEAAIRARADQEAATGQPRRALESYQDLLAKVLASKPDPENDLHQANDLSRIYRAIATLASVTGELPEAKSNGGRRTELWSLWDRKLPHNPYVQRQLTASLASVR
jgi:tetratricopeptide (TPR) repeat protein/predicted Ser/Thr protein kinase